MIKSIATAAAAFAAAALISVPTHAANEVPTPKFMTTPCPQEDSVNCYWDAKARGNHHGHSFFAIKYGQCGLIVRYWDRKYGRHHDTQYNIC